MCLFLCFCLIKKKKSLWKIFYVSFFLLLWWCFIYQWWNLLPRCFVIQAIFFVVLLWNAFAAATKLVQLHICRFFFDSLEFLRSLQHWNWRHHGLCLFAVGCVFRTSLCFFFNDTTLNLVFLIQLQPLTNVQLITRELMNWHKRDFATREAQHRN
jgi:hypothetical protein